MAAPIMRGTVLGSMLGILPGGGAALASFGAYTLEKKVSKNSAEFGKGAIEGVAGPESANNAGGADLVHSAADAGHTRPTR
jgi:putative tricarboxylic transport membrane protein